jgi:hypothetical protein
LGRYRASRLVYHPIQSDSYVEYQLCYSSVRSFIRSSSVKIVGRFSPMIEFSQRLWKEFEAGSLARARAALDRGEAPDARARKFPNITCLMVAAREDHGELVTLLLERGAAVNAVDSNQWTALHHAGIKGGAGLVRRLLAGPGLDCNPRDTLGYTPLMAAVLGNNLPAVRELAGDTRVDIGTKDDDGEDLLQAAGRRHNLEVIAVLREAAGREAPPVEGAEEVQARMEARERQRQRMEEDRQFEYDLEMQLECN